MSETHLHRYRRAFTHTHRSGDARHTHEGMGPAEPLIDWEFPPGSNRWRVFYDDYDRGTAFIALEHDVETVIQDGLEYEVAKAIVQAHNADPRSIAAAEFR